MKKIKQSSEIFMTQGQKEDLPDIRELLILVALPVKGIEIFIDHFLVLKKKHQIIGCVGLEINTDQALLRSLAVHPEFQHMGLGEQLFEAILEKARHHRVVDLYLLTQTAEPFFEKRGFRKISRDAVPGKISESLEFTECCPCSAACMTKNIEK